MAVGYDCTLCEEKICKYKMDFNSSGGIGVQVGEQLIWKPLCHSCAKEIAEAVLDEF